MTNESEKIRMALIVVEHLDRCLHVRVCVQLPSSGISLLLLG